MHRSAYKAHNLLELPRAFGSELCMLLAVLPGGACFLSSVFPHVFNVDLSPYIQI